MDLPGERDVMNTNHRNGRMDQILCDKVDDSKMDDICKMGTFERNVVTSLLFNLFSSQKNPTRVFASTLENRAQIWSSGATNNFIQHYCTRIQKSFYDFNSNSSFSYGEQDKSSYSLLFYCEACFSMCKSLNTAYYFFHRPEYRTENG